MATRTKTIEYAFDTSVGDTADATLTNLTQITVYIPETVISFMSATVDLGFQDRITATGGTITEHRCALRLGASAYTTVTELDAINQTGENIGGVLGPFDFTSRFTTSWTGTSMTCDVQYFFDQNSGTTLGMRSVTAKLYITYTYDDAPATNGTQIKTVRIPLESLVGSLTTTTNSEIGTNQIPILTGGSGMLPETGIVIRDYAFTIESNDNMIAATDTTLSVNIDSGTPLVFSPQEAALISDRYVRYIYRPTVPDTTAVHAFQMWANVAGRFNMATIMLTVTYEFNASTTTSILNSIQIPVEIATPLGISTSADASRFTRNISIQEPGTITLRQSSFRINFNATAPIAGINFRAGAQSYRAYTHSAGVVCGMAAFQQRIDAGSAQGAGITLARGFNAITIDGFATDTVDQMTNINGFLTINYTSDVPTAGNGAANHTIMVNLLQWDALLSDRTRINNYSIAIPEADYWIVGTGFIFYQWVATASMAVTFDVECLVGEGKGGGYYDIYADAYQSDSERACSVIWMRGRDVFKRFPTDPDPDRLDIETARDYRLFTSTATSNGLMSVITYSTPAYTVADSITGFSGTVNLTLHRASTDEKVGETSRVGDGAFSFPWYDNTEELYVVANDGTNVGRSLNNLAT